VKSHFIMSEVIAMDRVADGSVSEARSICRGLDREGWLFDSIKFSVARRSLQLVSFHVRVGRDRTRSVAALTVPARRVRERSWTRSKVM
jgi:hypothetical protein